MKQYFVFNGHSSADFDLYINGGETYNFPERDVELLEIPGRSGALTVDNGRYKNVTLPYKVGLFGHTTFDRIDAIREWLLTAIGYMRLEDSYHLNEYRMARYSGKAEWDVDMFSKYGEATLEFDCWPQRFLKIGEEEIAVTNGMYLHNLTNCPALPLVRLNLTGSAKLEIAGVQMSISGYTGPIFIDCNLQDAYYNNTNLNKYLTAPEFPALSSGKSQISWTGDITSCHITPRWWTL